MRRARWPCQGRSTSAEPARESVVRGRGARGLIDGRGGPTADSSRRCRCSTGRPLVGCSRCRWPTAARARVRIRGDGARAGTGGARGGARRRRAAGPARRRGASRQPTTPGGHRRRGPARGDRGDARATCHTGADGRGTLAATPRRTCSSRASTSRAARAPAEGALARRATLLERTLAVRVIETGKPVAGARVRSWPWILGRRGVTVAEAYVPAAEGALTDGDAASPLGPRAGQALWIVAKKGLACGCAHGPRDGARGGRGRDGAALAPHDRVAGEDGSSPRRPRERDRHPTPRGRASGCRARAIEPDTSCSRCPVAGGRSRSPRQQRREGMGLRGR
jgi:hypothetical protein